jgi:hypothetical protein
MVPVHAVEASNKTWKSVSAICIEDPYQVVGIGFLEVSLSIQVDDCIAE